MGLEGGQFTDCAKWGSMSLEDIMQRHEFLVKCGRFRTPDPKHPQLNMENPSLRSMLDTNEDNFASQVSDCETVKQWGRSRLLDNIVMSFFKVAGVSREEWVIYRALCVKEAEMATKEHPFVRVKPSMRKAYERRRKEAAELPEHVFDVSASTGI